MKEKIKLSELIEISKKLDIRVGIIIESKPIKDTTKLLQLTVNFGKDNNKLIVVNIGDELPKKFDLIGLKLPFIINIKPLLLNDVVSEGVMLPAYNEKGEIELSEFGIGSILM